MMDFLQNFFGFDFVSAGSEGRAGGEILTMRSRRLILLAMMVASSVSTTAGRLSLDRIA
jgi:hypothetical protein